MVAESPYSTSLESIKSSVRSSSVGSYGKEDNLKQRIRYGIPKLYTKRKHCSKLNAVCGLHKPVISRTGSMARKIWRVEDIKSR